MSSANRVTSNTHPVSIDHMELFASQHAIRSVDHEALPSSVGPQRTPRKNYRSSLYGSPLSRATSESPSSSDSARTSSVGSDSKSDEDTPSSPPSSSPSSSPARRCKQVFAYESDENITDNRSSGGAGGASKKTKKAEGGKPAGNGEASSRPGVLKSNPKESSGQSKSVHISWDSDSDEDNTIPRPAGKMGKPGRGGYALHAALNWPADKYDKIKKYINSVVEEKLNCTLPISDQALKNLQEVRDTVHKKYPSLNQYRNHWATDDFIRARLKVCKVALYKESLEEVIAVAEAKAAPKKKKGKRSRKH